MENLPDWLTIGILFLLLIVVFVGDFHIIKYWMSGDDKKDKKN